MMRGAEFVGVPGVAGVFSPADCRQTAESIASVQLRSGEIKPLLSVPDHRVLELILVVFEKWCNT